MKSVKYEFIVGLFVILGALLLAGLFIWFQQVVEIGQERYTIDGIFDNVYGMAPGTPVRYLGIDIGVLQATGFTDKADKVKLVLSIDAKRRIPVGAQLSVRPTGILGDYFLEFSGGHPEQGFMPTDGTAVVEGQPMLTIDAVMTMAADFTSKLDQNLDELGGSLTVLTSSLNRLLGDPKFQENLKATAAEAPEAIRAFRDMTTKIGAATDEAKKAVEDTRKLVASINGQVDRQAGNLDKITEDVTKLTGALAKSANAINETLASVNEILDEVKTGKGSVGKFIEKDTFHEKLLTAVDRLNEALEEVRHMAESLRKRWGQ